MHIHKLFTLTFIGAALLSGACSGRTTTSVADSGSVRAEQPGAAVRVPVFSADTAYAAIETQVAMGPRCPGSEAAAECARWIESRLNEYGADSIILQRTVMTDPMNSSRKVPVVNILGRFNPDAKNRILLAAHYDTRPIADEESDQALASRPIPGANDGGSGVGVMLELARMMGIDRPEVGVDLLFVDLEDSGISNKDESWCLGSQYFAANLPYATAAERPRAAIVLDMVGAPGARFHREAFSDHYNRPVVERVWAAAKAAGHASRFPDEPGGAILDDHLPLIRAGIPAIDIVESRSEATGGFPASWHTHDDNMSNIDRATLEAVGQTVAQFIYTYR